MSSSQAVGFELRERERERERGELMRTIPFPWLRQKQKHAREPPKASCQPILTTTKNRRVQNIYNITQQQPRRTRKKTSAIGDRTPSLHDCSHFFFFWFPRVTLKKREERESPIPSLIFFNLFHRHPLR
jgi:hypothetical protein